ncbi:MAG TPA: flippase [Vicinamibacterales bacterium]|nr:flippase [Vicinamibacterales bacterium]
MTDAAWPVQADQPLRTLARNVGTRYLFVVVEMAIGLLTLPFNLHHLGAEAYGLWMLTAGITVHFSILDLGYGGAMVKFVAQYRSQRDARGLNEIASTIFVLFSALGLLVYALVVGLAFNLDQFFNITPAQAETGKWILLIVGLNAAVNFGFSTFGGICAGFQRYDINNVVAIASSAVVAAVNVAVVLMGYGLIPLVAATTAVRLATYLIYWRNAYKVFPLLHVRPSLFRRARVREVTGFSIYASMIDWANKLNYKLDEVVIGVFLGAAPVAIWAVADRIISATQRLTNQSNTVLFPLIVDSDVSQQTRRLQTVLIEGTRLSLATVTPIAIVLIVLAEPIVRGWVGPAMLAAAPVVQVLALAVAFRVGNATSTTLLKGSGQVRYLAFVNLGTAVANVAMSAALIRRFGLVGVAIGTLVPILFSAVFLTFPVACRRVRVSVAEAVRRAVWPAVWPAVVVALALALVHRGTETLPVALAEAAAAGLLYVGLFILAVGRRDRAVYTARIWELAT